MLSIHGPGLGIILIEKIPIARSGRLIPRLIKKSDPPPNIKSFDYEALKNLKEGVDHTALYEEINPRSVTETQT